MVFFLSPEHQICRTNGDVESAVLEKLTISKNQAINIGQSKEGMYTLSLTYFFPFYILFKCNSYYTHYVL